MYVLSSAQLGTGSVWYVSFSFIIIMVRRELVELKFKFK